MAPDIGRLDNVHAVELCGQALEQVVAILMFLSSGFNLLSKRILLVDPRLICPRRHNSRKLDQSIYTRSWTNRWALLHLSQRKTMTETLQS